MEHDAMGRVKISKNPKPGDVDSAGQGLIFCSVCMLDKTREVKNLPVTMKKGHAICEEHIHAYLL